MRLSAVKFAEFLEERAAKKDGYIMCSIGQDPKKLNEWYFSGQYRGSQLEKARYWRSHAERVWDCQGLSDGYVTDYAGLGRVNVRARNNYADWCSPKGKGKIPNEYKLPGAAVFMRSGSSGSITHVGYLTRPVDASNPAGDWYVVEARGVMYGVVTTKLNSRNWNCWGLMTKYFDYENVQLSPRPVEVRLLRNGDDGEDVAEIQRKLIEIGYGCGHWGADGDFGDATEMAVRKFQTDRRIEVDGIVGSQTRARLEEALKDTQEMPEEPKRVKIVGGQCYIREEPNTRGKILGVAKENQILVYAGETSEEEWLKTDKGWVSGKYGRLIG